VDAGFVVVLIVEIVDGGDDGSKIEHRLQLLSRYQLRVG